MYFEKNQSEKNYYIINHKIRANLVRVNHGDNQLGIMPTNKAIDYAMSQGLDLILTVQNANPPVCIVEDFGKFKYENKLREKNAKKKQKEMLQVIKEIRLTPTIEEHDLDTKIKHMEEFLLENKSVILKMKFTRSEIMHKEIGFAKIDKIVERLKNLATVESKPNFQGKSLFCKLMPAGKKNEPARNESIK